MMLGTNGVDYDVLYRRVMNLARRLRMDFHFALQMYGVRIEDKMLKKLERGN